MTREEAIHLSIEHWQENVRRLEDGGMLNKKDYTGESCPLCLKYLDRIVVGCGECPLAKVDCCDDNGSVWQEFRMDPSVSNAQKMVEVLKSLL
jgi:hypothetical protein